jgi:hypothetical protein
LVAFPAFVAAQYVMMYNVIGIQEESKLSNFMVILYYIV